MPAGDRTGPLGLGPMTGRAMGFCAGYPVSGYANPGPGWGGRWFGWGRGRGFGRGRGWWWRWYWPGFYPPYVRGYRYSPYYYPQLTPQQELQMLKGDADALRKEMEEIEARMAELRKQEQTKK